MAAGRGSARRAAHAPPRRPVAPVQSARDGRRELGRAGESLAAEHLRSCGFAIVARNHRTRHGEIDLIAFDGHTLVFAEVKTRRVRAGGAPGRADAEPLLAGLSPRQRARLRRLSAAWLASAGRRARFAQTIRFDAIGVTIDGRGALRRLEHIPGAW
jgi:putative endonuclease